MTVRQKSNQPAKNQPVPNCTTILNSVQVERVMARLGFNLLSVRRNAPSAIRSTSWRSIISVLSRDLARTGNEIQNTVADRSQTWAAENRLKGDHRGRDAVGERGRKMREGFRPVVSRFIQAYSSKVSVSFSRIAYGPCEAFPVSSYLQQK